jgi:predicted transcriptional regulator
MPSIAASVRITDDAIEVLSGLAAKLNQPKAQVIERALRELEEKIFWSDVENAFERQASDPVESCLQQAEIRIWEGTERELIPGEQW